MTDMPKKTTLDLSIFLGPSTDVQTSIGKIYLYPLRVSDVSQFEKLAAGEPSARFRQFLPCVASLSVNSEIEKEREPLAPEFVEQLSDLEIETIAEAYAFSAALQRSRLGSKDKSGLPQNDTEPTTAYLDRLLQREIQDQAEEIQRIRKQMLGSASSIFDQVRKSSSTLGSTLTEFERLTKRSAPVEIHAPNMDHFHAMNEQFARQARERAEELEMVRLTGKMTVESAQTLKDLAEAATVLLEQLDKRDEKADKSTRAQINIAVWSVGVSAVLALFALIFSSLAYFQDRSNNDAGDKWQAKLLTTISDGNIQRATSERENQRLSGQVTALEAKIDHIEKAQRIEPHSKSDASAARRVTSPGSTLPPP